MSNTIFGQSTAVAGNVALNRIIIRTSGESSSFRRIVAYRHSGTLSNNIAFRGMGLPNDPTTSGPGDGNLNSDQGLSITAAQAKTQSTYSSIGGTGGWAFGTTESEPWRWGFAGAYPLPTLYWMNFAPTLPAHLQ